MAAGMLWKALWALIFGYVISAGIQAIVTRRQMADTLGDAGPRQIGLGALFGFISSSCSFAALAASRSVWVKGAHPLNAIAFLIASTNLVIELGIVLWVLLGWKFMLGNFLLGLLMIAYAALLSRLWFPQRLAEAGRRHAEQAMDADAAAPGDDENVGWRERLFSAAGWRAIAAAFFMEWRMVWKEILFGFTVAGFIAVFVPQSFWSALFLVPQGGPEVEPGFLVVLQNALVAPAVAFFTFIGSMGNVPLAAMLWSRDASLGGVMAFLGADLVAATVIWVHVKYYGWSYALWLSALLYVCMVAAGITVHYLFTLVGGMPTERPELQEMVHFSFDYTFVLNLVFLAIAGWLTWLHLRAGTAAD